MSEKAGFEGGCTCGEVRYRMQRAPLFVHCCHCRWCQRETGAAFALNGLLEATELTVQKGRVEMIDTPSNSGRGQRIAQNFIVKPARSGLLFRYCGIHRRAVCPQDLARAQIDDLRHHDRLSPGVT